jgi:F-type H+-transporting ATPase subunit b
LDALKPLGIEPALLIAYLVNFILLVVLLRLFLYRPVLNIMAERRRRIQESLEEADRVRREADMQQASFRRELEEARKVSQEAAARVAKELERTREAVLAEARHEADQIRDQARQQIEVERQQAMAEVQRHVVDLAVDVAQKVIGRTVVVDEQAQRQLIRQFLQETGELL